MNHNRRWLDQLNITAAIIWGSMFSFWVGILIYIKECTS